MARYRKRFVALAAFIVVLLAAAAVAATFLAMARSTEQWTPVPPVTEPHDSPGTPPDDAIILFGGSDLSAWVSSNDHGPARWRVHDGVFTVDKASGSIETRRKFRNYQLHLEWMVPANVTGSGQARGNSGIFLAKTGSGDSGYEVQILDAWQNPTYVNGMAGAVYKQHAPLANPARPPGQWQSYDINWTAPVFAHDGKIANPAVVTVVFNGVLVQDNFALAGETRFIGTPRYHTHGPEPIMLQAHSDPSQPVSFRNVWLRELP